VKIVEQLGEYKNDHEPHLRCYNIFEWGSWHPAFAFAGLATLLHVEQLLHHLKGDLANGCITST
jgi:hypothetical protein